MLESHLQPVLRRGYGDLRALECEPGKLSPTEATADSQVPHAVRWHVQRSQVLLDLSASAALRLSRSTRYNALAVELAGLVIFLAVATQLAGVYFVLFLASHCYRLHLLWKVRKKKN